MLFELWTGERHRSTLDLDLLASGQPEVAYFEAVFRDICRQAVPEDDGIAFPADQVRGEEIREEQRYAGIRIHAMALLDTARIPLQIDIGIGDAVTPAPRRVTYPTLLNHPAPVLDSYPPETVVAEKFEAMVQLGMANSRMKDYYDVWVMMRTFTFDGAVLASAIKATFDRRGTPLPTMLPMGLAPEFGSDRTKQTQWQAFVRRGRLLHTPPILPDLIAAVRQFVWPVVESLASGTAFSSTWHDTGSWRNRPK
jgi:Nucleotidyl transferase AbiEii toxin, Type IV TA system